MKTKCVEPDGDEKKMPPKKKGKGKPVVKAKPQWAGIANKMLGNE